MNQNNWYVITGGPATGKTTLVNALAAEGYQTVLEAARTVIDEAIAANVGVKQLRADEQAFQEKVTRLKIHTEAQLDAHTSTFFDRGMQDTHAYLKYYDYHIADWVAQAGRSAHYRKVFLLDPLPEYQIDYARTEDQVFRNRIQQLLHDTYVEFGMKPIIVPAMSVDDRLQMILQHVNQEQVA